MFGALEGGLIFAPFAFLMGLLMFLGLLLTLYVFYDILFRRPDMDVVEKLIWVVVVLTFNILGVLAYLVLVVSQETYLFDSALFQRSEMKRLTELEKLQDLHENGALTDEEFEREKEKLLDE